MIISLIVEQQLKINYSCAGKQYDDLRQYVQ